MLMLPDVRHAVHVCCAAWQPALVIPDGHVKQRLAARKTPYSRLRQVLLA